MIARLSNLKLAWQSVVLIAVFLFCELTFVSVLFYQLHQAEIEIAQQAHINEIMEQSQKLIYSLHDYEMSLGAWIQDRSAAKKTTVKQYQKIMTDAVEWLVVNLKGDAQLEHHIDLVSQQQNQVFRTIDKVMSRLEKFQDESQLLMVARGFYQRSKKQRLDWQMQTVELLKAEEVLLNRCPAVNAERRGAITITITCGALANLLLMFLLYRSFITGIRGRLNLMLDNTKRLAHSEKLNEPLGGKDELARLDGAMHEMALAIETGQKERQAFLAVVSHELRTPLTSIRGSIDILSMGVGGELSPETTEKTDAAQAEVTRVISIINDLLDLEKMDSGQFVFRNQRANVSDLIDGAEMLVSDLLEQREVTLELKESGEFEVEGDPERITQVVAILISNAAKASPAGERVLVEVDQQGDHVIINVVDHGCGVPAGLAAGLFERFRRDPASGAIIKGMGLPIASRIASGHRGTLTYAAGSGGGSIFCLTLPAASDRSRDS